MLGIGGARIVWFPFRPPPSNPFARLEQFNFRESNSRDGLIFFGEYSKANSVDIEMLHFNGIVWWVEKIKCTFFYILCLKTTNQGQVDYILEDHVNSWKKVMFGNESQHFLRIKICSHENFVIGRLPTSSKRFFILATKILTF